jgi:excisionase family DNA binding protein
MTKVTVTLKHAAEMLELSEFTLRRLVKRGKLRAARVGRRVLIPVSEIDRLGKPGANLASPSKEG